jgi:hypothetical protein
MPLALAPSLSLSFSLSLSLLGKSRSPSSSPSPPPPPPLPRLLGLSRCLCLPVIRYATSGCDVFTGNSWVTAVCGQRVTCVSPATTSWHWRYRQCTRDSLRACVNVRTYVRTREYAADIRSAAPLPFRALAIVCLSPDTAKVCVHPSLLRLGPWIAGLAIITRTAPSCRCRCCCCCCCLWVRPWWGKKLKSLTNFDDSTLDRDRCDAFF